MKNFACFLILTVWQFCVSQTAFSQKIKLTGSVKNNITNEVIPAASVVVKDGINGTYTDDNGNFQLLFNGSFPVSLLISSVGYEMKEVTATNNSDTLAISLKPAQGLVPQIVILATRIPIRILESPVSIERVSPKILQSTPVTSYYDAIASLKGIDMVTSSLTFKTPSTRGFNVSGNLRFNQLVDGMDNHAPGLNFAIGAVAGLTELDVESMELLPGASSVLYGSGGMNGTLLINSKNPFKYQGLSLQIREGVMNVDRTHRPDISVYNDLAIRWAKKIGEKFAFKFSVGYIRAKDWLADDSTNYLRNSTTGKTIAGTRTTDPNYDGVNVYGDETSVDIRPFLATVLPPNHPLLASPLKVSRTGYAEKDVLDPNTINLRLSGAVHYKITNKIEAQLMGFWGNGNTVYTGTDRYSFKNMRIGQYKFELKSTNWFMHVFTTQENAGETFNATVTTRIFNEAWKPSYNPSNVAGSWYPQYTGAFLMALQQGSSINDAHNIARAFADQGRPLAGSSQFKTLFDQVRGIPISKGGGLFLDKTDLWMAEAQYNFSNKIKFAEIIAGISFRKYILNSSGTIFIDTAGLIYNNEGGAYVQVTKKLLNERLTLSAAGRLDKNENFKSKFTPRFTALISLSKNNNLRLSYQTAYRLPSAVQQYIKLGVGSGAVLLGGLPWIVDYMKLKTNPVYEVFPDGSVSTTPYQYKEYKPEISQSFEAGYKGLIKNKLLIDVYAYISSYNSFIGQITLTQPSTGKVYVPYVNSENSKIQTHGFGAGLDYRLRHNFSALFNFFYDEITNIPKGFVTYFNTPKERFNIGFGNSGFGNNQIWSFNLQYRWQNNFFYESNFTQGNIPAFGTLDAQLSLKFYTSKSKIKIGGTNILNKYYRNAFGNPQIGGLYYITYSYNVF